MSNVVTNPKFSQVCVWPGTTLGNNTTTEFEKFMFNELNCRVQFLEIIITLPDKDSQGRSIQGTGGRSDLFFAIHDEDVSEFAIPRLQYGIRWVEDVLAPGNYNSPIYPQRLYEYRTWGKYNEEE